MRPQFSPGGRSRRRLLLGLGGIAALFLTEGALGTVLSRHFAAEARLVYETSLASVEQVTRLARDIERKRILADDSVLTTQPNGIAKVEAELSAVCSDFYKAGETYTPLIESANEVRLWQAAQTLNAKFDRDVHEVLRFSRNRQGAEALAGLSTVEEEYA